MLIRQYAQAAVGQLGSVLPSIVSLAILTRTLGPSAYGSYVVLMTAVVLATTFVAAGPQAAALVIAARSPARTASLHGQILLASVALLVLLGLLAPLWVGLLHGWLAPDVAPALVALNFARLPAVVYAALVTSQLSGSGRVGGAAALAVASALIGLLAPAGAVVAADPIAGAIVGTTAASMISAALAGVVATRTFGISYKPVGDDWREAYRISIPMHIGTMAFWIMLRMDLIVVSTMLGSREAGIYGLALGLSERLGMLTAPLYNATAWRISGRDRGEALRTLLVVARVEIAIGLLVALAAATFGPIVVLILSGRDFAAASVPFSLLALGAALLPVWSAVGLYVVSQLDGAWTTAKVQVAVAAVSIVAYVAIVPAVGIVGAAAASTGAYLGLVAAGLWLVRHSSPFGWGALLPGPELVVAWRWATHRGAAGHRQAPTVGNDEP